MPAQDNLNSKKLARNIRHRLADMLGSQWTEALDAAMNEMLLDEIEQFSIIRIPADVVDESDMAVHVEKHDGSIAWPLRKR